jgi:hypothetical protein
MHALLATGASVLNMEVMHGWQEGEIRRKGWQGDAAGYPSATLSASSAARATLAKFAHDHRCN